METLIHLNLNSVLLWKNSWIFLNLEARMVWGEVNNYLRKCISIKDHTYIWFLD